MDQLVTPLSPTRLGEWLQNALAIGEFKGIARHVVYELFKEEIFDTLPPLYKEIIDLLQEHSIERTY